MDSKKRSSLAKMSLPSVGSSLDDFLARVSDQEQAVDLSGFDPAQREAMLRDEIRRLNLELDQSRRELQSTNIRLEEARAAIAHTPRQPSRWGVVVAAFAIGGGLVFAVSTLLPRASAPKTQESAVTEPPAPKPIAITATPIEPSPASAAPITAPIAEPIAEPPSIAAKPTAPKPIKHTAPQRAPAPPDKKPDSGLYNPF